MNDDELMSRLHRLADQGAESAPEPAPEFWDQMAAQVTVSVAEAERGRIVRRRRSIFGGTGVVLAMAAAALLYVRGARVQHVAHPAVESDDSEDNDVFQDEDVGALTEGLDQQQLERLADSLAKGKGA